MIWKGIKEIKHFEPTTSKSVITIFENNHLISAPKLSADAFSTYFANVGNILDSEMPIVSKNPRDYLVHCPQSNGFIYFLPTICSEIENEISSLKRGKSF